jgi:hypothetical protein
MPGTRESSATLEQLAEALWIADGGIVSFHGFAYPTRMAVVRLADGGLWLWSPVALTPALAAAVSALGPVAHLVSPNSLHYLFLGEWRRAFPEARLWGPAATVARCGDLAFAGTLADQPPAPWAGQIDQFHFANSRFVEELIFLHRASGTALIADLSQTFGAAFLKDHWPWWLRRIARLSGMVEGRGYPPIDYRLSFRHRRSARPKIRALIAAHPRRVVVAHGEIVRDGGEAFLRQAFGWLV